MSIKYHSQSVEISTTPLTTGWSKNNATMSYAEILNNSTDGYYASSSTDDALLTFTVADVTVPANTMPVGVEVIFSYQGGAFEFTADYSLVDDNSVPNQSFPKVDPIPYWAQGGYHTESVYMPNRPCQTILGREMDWNKGKSDNVCYLNDFTFGVRKSGTELLLLGGVEVRIYYRERTSLDKLCESGPVNTLQALEIEGFPWIFTDQKLSTDDHWSFQDTYFGFDRKVAQGFLKTGSEIRSSTFDPVRTKTSFPGGSFEIHDKDTVAFRTKILENSNYEYRRISSVYSNGFVSSIFSYEDSVNRPVSRMVDSSAFNSIKGLSPKDFSSSLGGQFDADQSESAEFPTANTDDSYVYIGRECVWYGESTVDTGVESFGNSASQYALCRGQFGSLNGEHEHNKVTGVFPEVSQYPRSLSGRWCRIWTIPFDPATGNLLPLSTAAARTFIWANHSHSTGRGQNTFRISCAPFEKYLDKDFTRTDTTKVKGISLGEMQTVPQLTGHIEVDDASAGSKSSYFQISVDWSNTEGAYLTWNDLADELASTADTAVAYEYTGGSWQKTKNIGQLIFLKVGGQDGIVEIQYSAPEQESVTLSMTESLAASMGFDKLQGASPNDTVNDQLRRWFSKSPAPETLVGAGARKIYIEDEDQAEVGTFGLIKQFTDISDSGTVIVTPTVVGKGGMLSFSAGPSSTISGSSGEYYINVFPGSDGSLDDDRKPLMSEPGQSPLSLKWTLLLRNIDCDLGILAMMLSTGYGTNGTYDRLPRGFGLAIREELIDTQSFIRSGRLLSRFGKRTWEFDSPKSVSQVLDEELSLPLGLSLVQDDYGRLSIAETVTGFYGQSYPQVCNGDILLNTAVEQSFSMQNVINVVRVHCDYVNGKYLTKLEAREPNSIDRYGEKVLEIKSSSIRSIELAAGNPIASAGDLSSPFVTACRSFFESFAFERPHVSMTLGSRGLSLTGGKPITFNIARTLNSSNSLADGYSNSQAIVTSVQKDDYSGRCKVSIMLDRLNRRNARWAPSLKITAFDATNGIVTYENNDYSTGTVNFQSGLDYQDDVDFFQADDAVYVTENDSGATPTYELRTVSSIDKANSQLTLNATISPGTFTNGFVVFADYDNAVSNQLLEGYALIADSTGFISDDVEPYTLSL